MSCPSILRIRYSFLSQTAAAEHATNSQYYSQPVVFCLFVKWNLSFINPVLSCMELLYSRRHKTSSSFFLLTRFQATHVPVILSRTSPVYFNSSLYHTSGIQLDFFLFFFIFYYKAWEVRMNTKLNRSAFKSSKK